MPIAPINCHALQAWDGVRRVLEEMLEFGCVQGVFDAPVDLQEYPDYADHVERPMDLGTIQGEPHAVACGRQCMNANA